MKLEGFTNQDIARSTMIKNSIAFVKNYIKDENLLYKLTDAIEKRTSFSTGHTNVNRLAN